MPHGWDISLGMDFLIWVNQMRIGHFITIINFWAVNTLGIGLGALRHGPLTDKTPWGFIEYNVWMGKISFMIIIIISAPNLVKWPDGQPHWNVGEEYKGTWTWPSK